MDRLEEQASMGKFRFDYEDKEWRRPRWNDNLGSTNAKLPTLQKQPRNLSFAGGKNADGLQSM